jgi:hypothetical protein
MDAALIYASLGKDYYYLYDNALVPGAKITSNKTSFIAGVGFKW